MKKKKESAGLSRVSVKQFDRKFQQKASAAQDWLTVFGDIE